MMLRTTLFLFTLILAPVALFAERPDLNASPGGEEGGSTTIRVMTYNIHHGRGMDEEVNLRRIAAVIRAEEPDIVALQEVDRGVRRTAGRDLTKELAELTGMAGYFERNHPVQGGEYGNAILSRLPILERRNTLLQQIEEGEQRGVLQIVVEVKGTKLLILNTHFAHRASNQKERLFSVEQAKEIAANTPDLPVIFVGDFNDRPGSRVHEQLKEDYIDVWEVVGEGDGFTHRSDAPNKRIDYIWLSRDSGLTPLRAWVPPTLGSDHLPLVADVELRVKAK